MDKKLLEIIACPICKGKLDFSKKTQELICKFDKIAFPIKNGVPMLLEEQAKPIIDE